MDRGVHYLLHDVRRSREAGIPDEPAGEHGGHRQGICGGFLELRRDRLLVRCGVSRLVSSPVNPRD